MKKILLIISLTLSLFALDIKKAYYSSYNYEKMGDFKDAIKVLIPVYKKYPDGYTINLRLAWLFYLNKNYQNAIKHYQKAAMILPYSVEPKLGLMRVYNTIGDYDNSLKVGNSLLKTDYYNYYGNYYEIVALMGKKNYKVASELAQKMLTLYPTSVLFLNVLAENYWYMGKKDTAKKIFNDVLILDPNNIVAKEYLKK
ncbi:tetratricopeptide repeat protein [Caminibacter pacificus]